MSTPRLLVIAVTMWVGQTLLAQPTVPGYSVRTHASLPNPVYMSFDPAGGVLYVGRNELGNDAYKIRRIGRGGSPVEEYGLDAIPDPDAVCLDPAGTISGVAGSVLVGGTAVGSPSRASIWAVQPDQTVACSLGCPEATSNFQNPSDMAFDHTGRFLFCDDRSDNNTGAVMVSTGGEPVELFAVGERIFGLAIDAADRIYTGSGSGTIRIHAADGTLIDDAFVTGLGTGPIPLEFGSGYWGNYLYSINADTGELVRIDEFGTVQAIGTGFPAPTHDLKFGPDGAMYVASLAEQRILRISTTIPAVSEWGLAVITLSILVAGTLVLHRYSRSRGARMVSS